MSLAIEKALLGTPLPRGVALVMRKDEIERPLLTQRPDGSWQATIYAVLKNGLPLWFPPARHRPRPMKFMAAFVAQTSELTNMLRAQNAAKHLLEFSRRKLANRKRGLLAVRTARRNGNVFDRSPGRPPGILRSMEKTGSNRDRNCVSCGSRHRRSPCRI